MTINVSQKLKKYIFFIALFLFGASGIHLVYTYLYDGAKSEAIKGGSVSEAIIGSFPHFNPLIPSNDHNDYINRLLYRSMMEYSPEQESLVSNLVNCNLDNLLYIVCDIENNVTWSDGSSITTDDMRATFNIIQETKVNPILASLLESTTIETTDDTISFSRSSRDTNILSLFLQPILPSSVVENLNSENVDGKFSEIGGIYSGKFRLVNITQDETVGVTRLTLGKNESYFENPLFLDFLILNLYRDEAHFLKNKNAFNIFNDKENLIGNSLVRLKSHEYILPQFTGFFINSENITANLRQYILSGIDREEIIQEVGANKVQEVKNPFLSDEDISPDVGTYDFEAALESLGFYSKKEILKSILQNQSTQEPAEQLISQEATQIIEVPARVQSDLSVIISPTEQKYNFVSEDNILITGTVPDDVDSVFINDYELQGFSPGDDVFYYRLLESYETISEGENTYKVYFGKGKEKELVDEFVYIYNTDSEILDEIESRYFEETITQEVALDDSSEQESEVTSSTTGNDISNLSSAQAQQLEDGFYYDANGSAFSLDFVYANTDDNQYNAAQGLIAQLEKLGIKANVSSLTLGEITTALREETLEYDIILLGLNLGFQKTDIFSYFHSSQVENGYNFSNTKKLGLDILLEELKSNKLSETKQQELTNKILDILKEENIVYTIFTPKIQLLVDHNIKDLEIPEYLPDTSFRHAALSGAYILEKKIISTESKGVIGFFEYLLSNLFGKKDE